MNFLGRQVNTIMKVQKMEYEDRNKIQMAKKFITRSIKYTNLDVPATMRDELREDAKQETDKYLKRQESIVTESLFSKNQTPSNLHLSESGNQSSQSHIPLDQRVSRNLSRQPDSQLISIRLGDLSIQEGPDIDTQRIEKHSHQSSERNNTGLQGLNRFQSVNLPKKLSLESLNASHLHR